MFCQTLTPTLTPSYLTTRRNINLNKRKGTWPAKLAQQIHKVHIWQLSPTAVTVLEKRPVKQTLKILAFIS